MLTNRKTEYNIRMARFIVAFIHRFHNRHRANRRRDNARCECGGLPRKHALLTIQNAFCHPGEYKWMENIFETITGAKPQIFEYKNMTGWVIWDDVDMQTASDDEKFILMDEETLYPSYNEAVLYSDNELAFGFDIDIYNPYDMKLPEQMVKEIITNFKPSATQANIIMHDANGREYQYPGYYYFAHYGKDLYYPETFED